jgi:hypothetical protein
MSVVSKEVRRLLDKPVSRTGDLEKGAGKLFANKELRLQAIDDSISKNGKESSLGRNEFAALLDICGLIPELNGFAVATAGHVDECVMGEVERVSLSGGVDGYGLQFDRQGNWAVQNGGGDLVNLEEPRADRIRQIIGDRLREIGYGPNGPIGKRVRAYRGGDQSYLSGIMGESVIGRLVDLEQKTERLAMVEAKYETGRQLWVEREIEANREDHTTSKFYGIRWERAMRASYELLDSGTDDWPESLSLASDLSQFWFMVGLGVNEARSGVDAVLRPVVNYLKQCHEQPQKVANWLNYALKMRRRGEEIQAFEDWQKVE